MKVKWGTNTHKPDTPYLFKQSFELLYQKKKNK